MGISGRDCEETTVEEENVKENDNSSKTLTINLKSTSFQYFASNNLFIYMY